MPDEPKKDVPPAKESSQGGTATAKPKGKTKSKSKEETKPKPPQPLPPWKVLLHNDDVNGIDFVIVSIVELTPLNEQAALMRTKEAHDTGVSLLLVTHRERAELYQEQFQAKKLTVTIEPAE